MRDLSELPGHELFLQGVDDLRSGRKTESSLVVALARTRLAAAGLDVPVISEPRPAHQLYDLLASEFGDAAHARYNALIRRIASFAQAAEHAASR